MSRAMSGWARSAGSRSGRWSLQPSELMKISLVLALARYPARQERRGRFQAAAILPIALAMIGIPAVFVVLQPNLGTTLIIVADGCSLLFLAGLSWWWIAPALGAVAVAVPIGLAIRAARLPEARA